MQLGESDSVQDTLAGRLWKLAGLNLDMDPASSPRLTPAPPEQPSHTPHPPQQLAGHPSQTPAAADHFDALNSAPDSPLEGEGWLSAPTNEATAEGTNIQESLEEADPWSQDDMTVEGENVYREGGEGTNLWEEPVEGARLNKEGVANTCDEEEANSWKELLEETTFWDEEPEEDTKLEDGIAGANTKFPEHSQDTTLEGDEKMADFDDFEKLETFMVSCWGDCDQSLENSSVLPDITGDDLAWDN